MAFGEFGDVGQRFVNLLAAMVGQPQFDHALDRQAYFGQVDLGLVAGDHAAGFELGYAFGNSGRGEVDRARQLRVGRAAVFEQGTEKHAVVFVHEKVPASGGFRKHGL